MIICKNLKLKSIGFLLTKIVMTFFALLIITCSEYNPFEDYSNAKIFVLKRSFDNKKNISIFSTESLSIIITVPQLVDSIKVTANKNRLFENNTYTYNVLQNRSKNDPQTVRFSYSDTGLMEIEYNVFRSNSEVIGTKETLYVKSGVQQKSINGAFGTALQLFTEPVRDHRINYVWNFNDTIIQSENNDPKVIIMHAPTQGVGYLLVTDGTHTSPATPFNFSFLDTIRPNIRILNTSMHNDTLLTDDSSFTLNVSITDIGTGKLDSVSINGSCFDYNKNDLYIKTFDKLDTVHNLFPVVIYAKDNSKRGNNVAKKIYLRYDTSVKNETSFKLSVLLPSNESCTSSNNNRTFYGRIENSNKNINVTIYVNKQLYDTVNVSSNNDWYKVVPLEKGMNQIMVVATDGKCSDTINRFIKFDPLSHDTTPPVIISIFPDGYTDKKDIQNDSVRLRIVTFDEESQIGAVKCNELQCTKAEGYQWLTPFFKLVHLPEGTLFNIKVTDTNGYEQDTSIVLVFNKRFDFIKPLRNYGLVTVGSLYRDTAIVNDKDNDHITIQRYSSDTSFHISGDGVVDWLPDSTDIGQNKFIVKFSDGYFDTLVTVVINVLKSNDTTKVQFDSSILNLKKLIEVPGDTLKINIRPKTGYPDFLYNAYIAENGRQLNVKNDILQWTPTLQDTGLYHVIIEVKDANSTSDTATLVMEVVPKNRPLSIECISLPDTLLSGAIDMHKPGVVNTVKFRINDPDIDDVENFTLQVRQNGATDSWSIGTNRLFTTNIYSSSKNYGIDTLIVRVNDRVGHSAVFSKPVDYGEYPELPQIIAPQNGMRSYEDSVCFKWKNASKNKYITYGIILSDGIDSMQQVYTGIDTQFTYKMMKSGVLLWQIVADNGKIKNFSPIQTLMCRITGPLTIITNENDFQKSYTALKDTIRIPVQTNAVNKDVVFKAFLGQNMKELPVIRDTIVFIPGLNDTGKQKLSIYAKDTVLMDSVVFNSNVNITFKRNITLIVTNDFLHNDTLDMRQVPDTAILNIRIQDNDTTTDQLYSVQILNGELEQDFQISSKKEFQFRLTRPISDTKQEEMSVVVNVNGFGEVKENIIVLYK